MPRRSPAKADSNHMEAKKKKQIKKTKKPTKKSTISYSRAKKTFDQGVPASFLNLTGLKTKNPTIHLSSSAELSPFVVSFAKDKLNTVEDFPLVELNFAVPEHEFASLTHDDEAFVLTRDDLQDQLLEEEFTPTGNKKISLPLSPILPSFGDIREAILNFKNKNNFTELETEDIDLNQINVFPDSTSTMFDLPEMEEDEKEESDVINWEDVVRSISEQEFTTTALAEVSETKISWRQSFGQAFNRLQNLPLPIRVGTFETPAGWHRALTAFILVSFAFVLPLHAMETINDLRSAKGNLTQSGISAMTKLNEAVSLITTNSASAASSFEAAEKDFSQARSTLDDLGATASLVLSVLPSTRSTYLSGTHLIAAGENLSRAGEKVSQGLISMQAEGLNTTGRLEILTKTFESILPALQTANSHIEKVDPTVLPSEYQDRFSELQTVLPSFLSSAEEITKFADALTDLLGAQEKKRYLLLFQNNTEIRPTGGFLGSFAVLDVSHGQITGLNVPEGGSYDLQGSLENNIISPLPLQLISARWEFQDANWFPDFPTSARQALEFYYDSGNPTIDGVVAVNATFMTSLLELLGPIEMNEYNRTIDSENFLFETQKIVEFEYVNYEDPESTREETAPKAFIGDLSQKLLERVKELEPTEFLPILDAAQKGLAQKDVQIYFPNDQMQKAAMELGWTGEVKKTDRDYLMVINSNLGGGKTDLVIDENIDLKVDIKEDGSITNTLTITRTHNGINGAIFTGVNNVDFMRVYVPRGSNLISASGFTIPDISLFERPGEDWVHDTDVLFVEENASVDPKTGTIISEESGKTVFGNWVQTKPGETTTTTFVYELPFGITTDESLIQSVKNKIGLTAGDTYSLLVQKQSGALNRTTKVSVSEPENPQILWISNKDQKQFNNDNDSFLSILFAK